MKENKSKFSRDNYITILGWMITDLKLSGNELLCYAIIYGFSQTDETEFTGSLNYLAGALNITKDNARKVLARLVDKGLIVKRVKEINNVRFCSYFTKVSGGTETVTGVALKQRLGGTETATNNTIYNNNIERESAREAVALDSSSLISIIEYYNERCASTNQAPTSLQCIPPIVRSSLVERIKQVGVTEVKRVIDVATSPDCWCHTRPSCSLKFILDENNFSRIGNGELTDLHNDNGNGNSTSRPKQRPTYEERQASFQQFIIDKLATGRALSDGEIPF